MTESGGHSRQACDRAFIARSALRYDAALRSETGPYVLATTDLIDVDRRLCFLKATEVKDDNLEYLLELLEMGMKPQATWDEVLKARVCLLIGRANAGKSSELQLLHKRLKDAGHKAYLLDIKTLFQLRELDLALGDSAADFKGWRASSDRDAFFLLDSIDEAELFARDAFERALRLLSRELSDAQRWRMHCVISTRPGGWQSTAILDAAWSALRPEAVPAGTEDGNAQSLIGISDGSAEMIVAALCPLSENQAIEFLKTACAVPAPESAIQLCDDLGLNFALHSPGDLKWLAEVCKSEAPVLSRSDALAVASRRLLGNRKDGIAIPDAELMAEMEALCAASLLCEDNAFLLRNAPEKAKGLPLTDLLAHRDRALESVIRAMPMMADAGLQRIKIVPERLQHFLAARWLALRANSLAEQQALVDLFRRESMAGPLVPWRMLIVSGWISSMCPGFCEKLLPVAPHAVLLMGDLHKVAPHHAQEALQRTCELLKRGHPLFPRALALTGDDYWQAARNPALRQAVLDNLERYPDSELCSEMLLKIIERSADPAAMPVLRRFYAPDRASRVLDLWLDAVQSCGTPPDTEWAIRQLASMAHKLPPRILLDTCARVIRANCAPELLVDFCRHLPPEAQTQTHHFSFAAREAGDLRALTYAHALLDAAEDLPGKVKSLDEREEDELPEHQRLGIGLGLARAVMKGLLENTEVAASCIEAILDVLDRIESAAIGESGYRRMEGFPALLGKHPRLHEAALRRVVQRLSPQEAYKLLPFSEELYVALDAGISTKTLHRLREEATSDDTRQTIDTLADWLKRQHAKVVEGDPSQRARRKPPGTNSKQLFQTHLQALREASRPDLLYHAAHLATQSGGRFRGAGDWASFSREFGAEVFDAVQEGLRRLWRVQSPRYNEQASHEVYEETVAGLAALHLELDSQTATARLQPAEVDRALEYAPFELNYLPPWLGHVQALHPQAFEDFIVGAIERWHINDTTHEHARKIIRHLAHQAETPSDRVKNAVRSTVDAGAWKSTWALREALNVLVNGVQAEKDEYRDYVVQNAELAWTAGDAELAVWFCVTLASDPGVGVRWLEGQRHSPEFRRRLLSLASYRRDATDTALLGTVPTPEEHAKLLERMYLLFVACFRHSDDPQHLGAYTPNALDHAGHLRDELVLLLARLGGAAAYHALERLATRSDVEEAEMRWLHRLAFSVAEEEAKAPAWKTQDFLEFSRHRTTPLKDAQSLWIAVRQDVDEVIRNLAAGKFSPRRMLQSAVESDMQLWMSRELELLSRDRYRVERELELANATTPDLTAQSPAGHIVTLELKLGDGRYKKSLITDLRHQLYDDYLQRPGSDHGIFTVMWREEADPARRPATHARRQKTVAALQSVADELTRQSGGRRHVLVRGFTCPLPTSPRNEKVTTKPRR